MRLRFSCGVSLATARHAGRKPTAAGQARRGIIDGFRGCYSLLGALLVTGFIKAIIADSLGHKVANAVITVGILCLKVLVNHSVIHFNIWPIISY